MVQNLACLGKKGSKIMDEMQLAGLMQFITVTISHHVNGLRQDIGADIRRLDQKIDDLEERLSKKMDDKLSTLDRRLSKKIDDLSAAVGEALDTINEETNKQLQDHERRLVRLEKHAT